MHSCFEESANDSLSAARQVSSKYVMSIAMHEIKLLVFLCYCSLNGLNWRQSLVLRCGLAKLLVRQGSVCH